MAYGAAKPLVVSSLNNECYKQIKNMILCGDIPWGTKIEINQLATSFGISKFPVIKAIERLALEKLVIILPNKGTYVVFPQKKDIEEVSEIRLMIECFACRQAFKNHLEELVEKLRSIQSQTVLTNPIELRTDFRSFLDYDREFHSTLVACVHNDQLLSYYKTVRTQIELFRVQTFCDSTVNGAIKIHSEIAARVVARDLEGALKLLTEHLGAVQRETIASLPTQTPPNVQA